jgi:hypothetical protein
MNDLLSPKTEVTYPWTVMVKFQTTNPTNGTMMGPGRFPFVIATAFIAGSKVPILVNALVGLGQGLFIRHMII